MQLSRRKFLYMAAGAATLVFIPLTLSGQSASSQTTRTVRIIVPFPPGGSADILTRLLGEQLNRATGLTVVIENRPGGGAAIAYEAVAHAAPDGNTLVINGNSLVINPHFRKVNYDPLTSFEPVCHLVNSPNLIVVNSSSPIARSTIISSLRARGPASLHSRQSVLRPHNTSGSSYSHASPASM